jgi:hypothetical protein
MPIVYLQVGGIVKNAVDVSLHCGYIRIIMNRLADAKSTNIVVALAEGNSFRVTARMCVERLKQLQLERMKLRRYDRPLSPTRAATAYACHYPYPNRWPSPVEVFPCAGRKLDSYMRPSKTHTSGRNVERVDGGYGNNIRRSAKRPPCNPRIRSVYERPRMDTHRPYTRPNGECALRFTIHSVNDRAT